MITVRGEFEKSIKNMTETLEIDDQIHFLSKAERKVRIRQLESFKRELVKVIEDGE